MPFGCAVAECRNSKKTKTVRGSALLFHRFLRDENLRKVSITKCKRAGGFNVKNFTTVETRYNVVARDHTKSYVIASIKLYE